MRKSYEFSFQNPEISADEFIKRDIRNCNWENTLKIIELTTNSIETDNKKSKQLFDSFSETLFHKIHANRHDLQISQKHNARKSNSLPVNFLEN